MCLTELRLNLLGEKLHLGGFTVHEHDMLGLALTNQLHDSFGVGMRTERHVLHRHLNFHLLLVELQLPLSVQNLPANCAGYTIPWHDNLQQQNRIYRE